MPKYIALATCATIVSIATSSAAEVEVYGIAALGQNSIENSIFTDKTQNLNTGGLFGASIYTPTLQDFEIGFDLLSTSRDYSTFSPNSELNSFSAMVNGRYTANLFNSTSGYIGGGLGGIQLDFNKGARQFDSSNVISGYQLELGIRKEFNDMSVFTGIKYQSGFKNATIEDQEVEYNSLGLIAGFRF